MKKSEVVELTWEVPGFEVERFLIYARIPNGKWKVIDGVEGNVFKYESSFYYGKDIEFVVQPK